MDPVPVFVRLAGHPLRWRLLTALAGGDHRVRELVALVGEPQNLVSYHLRLLRDGGLVTTNRSSFDGRDTYYHLDLDRCAEALAGTAAALHPALWPTSAGHAPDPGGCAPDPSGHAPDPGGCALDSAGHAPGPALTAAPGPASAGRDPDQARVAASARRDPDPARVAVLFVCTGNSARSPIAEALLRHRTGGRVDVRSAGGAPKPEFHAGAVRVLRDAYGLDVAGRRPRHWDTLTGHRFDYVITLCDRAREVGPAFPGRPRRVHWSVPDPAADGGDAAFRRAAADLDTRVRHLVPVLAPSPETE